MARTIAHRELRNSSSAILREVQAGRQVRPPPSPTMASRSRSFNRSEPGQIDAARAVGMHTMSPGNPASAR